MDVLAALVDFALRALAVAFSWPVAIVIIAYWFREPLKKLLDEIRSAKGPGFQIERQTGVRQEPVAGPDLSKNPLEAAAPPGNERSTSGRRFEIPDSPLVERVKKGILEAEHTKDMSPADREQVIAKALAERLIALSFERLYRNIFGSQIEAIAKANITGGTTMTELKSLFEQYQKQYPDFHKSRTFEQWFGWMTSEHLIEEVDGMGTSKIIRPTLFGADFLHYILTQGLPYQKAG